MHQMASRLLRGITSWVPRLLFLVQLVFHRVDQRLVGGLDDVLGDADGAPAPSGPGLDQDADRAAVPCPGVEDADLVVDQRASP